MLKTSGKQTTYDSLSDWNSQILGKHSPKDPVNLSFMLNKDANITFADGHALLTSGEMRWIFHDIEGELITDYTLKNITVDCNIQSRREFAQIWGHCSPKFTDIVVNGGYQYMDMTGLWLEHS